MEQRHLFGPARRALFLTAVVLGVAACGGGTEPSQAANLTRVAGDQQDGVINAPLTLPLSVRVTNAGGGPVAGVTVTWTVISGGGSVSPTVSTTDSDGSAGTTWTLGPAPGEQVVTASAAGLTTTFSATAGNCDATVTMGAGAFCAATPGRAANMQVVGASGAEFVAIVHRYNGLSRASTPVNAHALGATGVAGPPTPDLLPVDGMLARAGAAVVPDVTFERDLRRRERTMLPPLVRRGAARGVGNAAFSVEPAPARPQVVGDVMTLNANSSGSCTTPRVDRQGQIKKISANAILVEDTGNPPGGFTDADRDEILAQFESHIRPTVTGAFGNTTDVDANGGRVILFYTIKVNELTPHNQPGSYVGGFFFSRDLFPRNSEVTTPTNVRLTACASSNAAEIVYLLAPDPNGVHSAARTTQFVKMVTPGTIAHELQHLVNASKRLYMTPGATFPEVVWLDEGLSHIAEELTYYSASGLGARSNLDRTTILATAPREAALSSYQLANLSRFSSFLRSPAGQSPWGETPSTSGAPDWDDLETRGAIWSFLRWAADHHSGGETNLWRGLSNVLVGIDNLRNSFGADISARFREWAVANYTDDTPAPPANARFQHPSWHFRDALRVVSGNSNQFPMVVFGIANATVNFNLAEGGAAYLRFGVAANATATVSVRSGSGNLPAGTVVWLVRTK